MNYQLSDEFKAAFTSYLFILTPFILLTLIKLLTGKMEDLLLTGDWAIASAMMYSTSIYTVRSASRKYKGNLNDIGLDWFVTKTSLWSSINVAIYAIVLIKPSFLLGILQLALFGMASLSHLKYSRLSYRLSNETI